MAYNPNVYIPPGTPPAVAWQMQNSGAMSGPPAPLNIDALIAQNPMLQGQLRQIGWGQEGATGGGMLAQSLAPLDEQYNAALVNFGGIPAGVNASATLRGLAADATRGGISTLAGLQRNLGYANSFSSGQAAARGLGLSGEPGFQRNVNTLNYDVNRAAEQAKLMQYLSQVQQQRVAATSTAMGQAQTSVSDAYDRLAEQIRNGTIADPSANYTNPNRGYTPGQQPAAYPRTNPATFRASPRPQIGLGQPGNRFQVLPGGRAPFGDYRAPAARPATSYGVPGQGARALV